MITRRATRPPTHLRRLTLIAVALTAVTAAGQATDTWHLLAAALGTDALALLTLRRRPEYHR